ncbi:hypothetical protein ZIOFF_057017 [Zingiber officinale]|uniref:Uncharacterized protein n=1 Tax=Zingiber officinale TaxID=94328 RepID=A0A8J5FN14_ZINOF|nr:hypothetical protein ZIOFF_057017 [Zingiber officinale]
MSSSQSQQRKRGKTIMRDIHALHPDHVLIVEFNERGQPYGDLQPTFANFIETIAQNGLVSPLHNLDWRKMPTNCLNDAWKLVTARFYIPNYHRKVIMQMMGAAWRWWRTRVKATSYDSNTPLEELVAIQPIPHGLTAQTWEVLYNYWKSIEFQENGRKPSRIEIQQLSRRSRKKGGAAIDNEAIQIERHISATLLSALVATSTSALSLRDANEIHSAKTCSSRALTSPPLPFSFALPSPNFFESAAAPSSPSLKQQRHPPQPQLLRKRRSPFFSLTEAATTPSPAVFSSPSPALTSSKAPQPLLPLR